jgi:hypothetical protein
MASVIVICAVGKRRRMRCAMRFNAGVDRKEGFRSGRNRKIGEVDINGEPEHVANEEIYRGAAFEREAILFRDVGKEPDQQRRLGLVHLIERH